MALMGRNGVGKTTLLKTVMGLLRPLAGEIFFDGQEITHWAPEKRAREGIGYVPQGRDIFPYLTVEENLLLGLEAHKAGRAMAIPEGLFDLFPALKSMLLRKGGNLSGGEQQQLAIARVLVSEPKLLLLDEPTEGIQPSIVLQIENTIRFIKEQGTISILLVEQYLEFALRLADYYYIMEKGSIVSEGITHDISKEVIANHLTV
jgi:urea transport system ATP-binding protein